MLTIRFGRYTLDITFTDRAYEAAPIYVGDIPDHKKLLEIWSNWCQYYEIDWHPLAADYRIAKRLTERYPIAALERLAREFWLTESEPLFKGCRNHLVLFSSYVNKHGQSPSHSSSPSRSG